jgi:two-component system NtrC family sensor kinase
MLTHIKEIVETVSNSYGDEFFTKITLAFNKVLHADYTFIARINTLDNSYKTKVLIAKGKVADNVEYSLKNSLSANIADSELSLYLKDVCRLYPEDKFLHDMNIQATIGIPLLDSKQQVIGLIATLYENEQIDENDIGVLFKLFSGRIAAELERLDYEQSLKDKISACSLELSETVTELQLTQKQLVESEKMSALGNLVAGVSHEVNTPLGIAITTHSIMADEFTKLKHKLDSKSLSMKDMESFRQTADSALVMQGENLARAKKLIENFKKTAADQHQLEIETLDIGQYYQRVLSTLRSILKPYNVNLKIECEKEIILATYPGIHAQILTNLVNNSVKHGFSKPSKKVTDTENIPKENKINIVIQQLDNDAVEIIYTDNGCGLSNEAKHHVFDPFFTTARKRGGIGLGMSIVFNLINKELNGSIEIKDVELGACFHYQFKESNFDVTLE